MSPRRRGDAYLAYVFRRVHGQIPGRSRRTPHAAIVDAWLRALANPVATLTVGAVGPPGGAPRFRTSSLMVTRGDGPEGRGLRSPRECVERRAHHRPEEASSRLVVAALDGEEESPRDQQDEQANCCRADPPHERVPLFALEQLLGTG